MSTVVGSEAAEPARTAVRSDLPAAARHEATGGGTASPLVDAVEVMLAVPAGIRVGPKATLIPVASARAAGIALAELLRTADAGGA